MRDARTEFRPDMVDFFERDAWPSGPATSGSCPVRPWLMSVFGAALFAGSATALVQILGG